MSGQGWHLKYNAMPRYKRRRSLSRKRYSSRRRYIRRKKRKFKRYNPRRNLIIGGFPKSKLVRLRYAQEITLDAPSGLVSEHLFVANGMYDPDYTGTGHQPSNFDQWMNVYDHYTVLGSRIVARYMPTNGGSIAGGGYFGIMLIDDANTFTQIVASGGVTNVFEQKLNNTCRTLIGQHSLNAPNTVSKNFSARKFFGKPKSSIIGDSLYRGDVGNNPNEKAWFSVYQMTVGGNNPVACNVLITIEFIALLTEPKQADAS